MDPSSKLDPKLLPLPLIPPLPPQNIDSNLTRIKSVPDLSAEPDPDGYFWSMDVNDDEKIPKSPINKEKLEKIQKIINDDPHKEPDGYSWEVSLQDPCIPQPEKESGKFKDIIRGAFRPRSKSPKETGARPKFKKEHDYIEIRNDQTEQIDADRVLALALEKQLEKNVIPDKKVNTLEREEREYERERLEFERDRLEHERQVEEDRLRMNFESKMQRFREERQKLKRDIERHSKKRIVHQKRVDRDYDNERQGRTVSRTRQRIDSDIDRDGYESNTTTHRSVSPRERKIVSHKYHTNHDNLQGRKVHRERGNTVHHINLARRIRDSSSDTDSESEVVTNQDIMKKFKALEANSDSGKIHIPSLDMIPYPSDQCVGPDLTATNRNLTMFYKQYEMNRAFPRKAGEHIIRFLTRIKRAIEGGKFHMDSRQFVEFVLKFLDEQTSSLFNETYEIFCNFSKYDFLDYLVTSVMDFKEQGELNTNFWSYDPKYDPKVNNVITLVTKLSQLMSRTNFKISDMIDKLIVLLPSEFVSRIKKHKAKTDSVALDVVLYELHKHDTQITEFLVKNKVKKPTPVRTVRQDVSVAEVVDDDDIGDVTEGMGQMYSNDQEHVHYVPYRNFPAKKEDLGPNQYIAPRQQQQNRGQPSNGQYQNSARYKQMTCSICFKNGHLAETCRMPMYCTLCNSTQHIAPTCNVYRGVAAVTDDCPSCLSLFSLRLKHSAENCRLNKDSPFSIPDDMLMPGVLSGNKKGE